MSLIELSYNQAILLQIIHKKSENICSHNIYSNSVKKRQNMEMIQCPSTDDYESKMWHIHTIEYISSVISSQVLMHAMG